MIRMKTAMLAIALAAGFGTPAAAQAGDGPDWWLVYGQDRSGPVRFVDLAAARATPHGTEITVLTVDAQGREQRRTATIDCADAPEPGSLPAFICGTEGYRQKSGLNIRDFPPAELARIYLRTNAG